MRTKCIIIPIKKSPHHYSCYQYNKWPKQEQIQNLVPKLTIFKVEWAKQKHKYNWGTICTVYPKKLYKFWSPETPQGNQVPSKPKFDNPQQKIILSKHFHVPILQSTLRLLKRPYNLITNQGRKDKCARPDSKSQETSL